MFAVNQWSHHRRERGLARAAGRPTYISCGRGRRAGRGNRVSIIKATRGGGGSEGTTPVVLGLGQDTQQERGKGEGGDAHMRHRRARTLGWGCGSPARAAPLSLVTQGTCPHAATLVTRRSPPTRHSNAPIR